MAAVHQPATNINNGAQTGITPPQPPIAIPGSGTQRYPLVTRGSALVMVVKAAMNSRAEKGQHWLHLASASANEAHCFDLATLVLAAPAPWLGKYTLAQLRALYEAALQHEASVFDLQSNAPTLDAVVDHVLNNTGVSRSALVLACIYVDRLAAAAPHLFVTESNVQRLFGVAFMLAAKWLEDAYYSSAIFADLYCMSVQQLNELESAFTAAIGFNLFVSTEQFRDAQLALMTEALDTPSSLNIFQTLVNAKVADVHKAFDATRTWGKHPDGGRSAGFWAVAAGLACDVGEHGDEHEMESREFSTLELDPCEAKGRKVVAQLARAQLDHDYDARVPAESFATELQRRFAENGVFRYAKLQLLAGRQQLDDLVLPPLERVTNHPPVAPSPPAEKPSNDGEAPLSTQAEQRDTACAPGGSVSTTSTVLAACTTRAPAGGSSMPWPMWPGRCHSSRYANIDALRPGRRMAAPEPHNPAVGIWSASRFTDFCPVRSR
ncbi:Cyclin [Gracilaria domingensis]|nr:Cyclin [Gracilaria domingensis]